MATKPGYTVDFSRREYPHQDIQTETIYFKNGSVVINTLYDHFVNNITLTHNHTSVSTKPWPNGKPPRWTSYSRNHWKATTDLASGSVVWTPGSAWPEVNQRRREATGGWGTVFMRSDLDFAGIFPDREAPSRDVLDNKIRNKLRDELNALVMLAETGKSLDTVTSRLRRIGQGLLQLKKGNFLGAWKVLGSPPVKRLSAAAKRKLKREIVDPRYREFAKQWLELQYGWLPLCSDIANAVNYASNTPKSSFIRATEKTHKIVTVKRDIRSNIDGGIGRHLCTRDDIWRKSYVAEVAISSPYLKRLSEVGMIDPLSLVWELVPFSFVVDWFLPIGDYLSSLTATLGTEIRGCLYTEQWTTTTTYRSSLVGASAADEATGFGEYSNTVHFTQRSFPGFPPAKLPVFKNPLSATHAANALALVTSIFTGRK